MEAHVSQVLMGHHLGRLTDFIQLDEILHTTPCKQYL